MRAACGDSPGGRGTVGRVRHVEVFHPSTVAARPAGAARPQEQLVSHLRLLGCSLGRRSLAQHCFHYSESPLEFTLSLSLIWQLRPQSHWFTAQITVRFTADVSLR